MLIEIESVGKPYKEGKWTKLELNYIRDGKKVARKLVDIGDTKVVFNVLKEAQPGESYEITLVKSDDGQFQNWVGAVKTDATASVAGSPVKTSYSAGPVKNTYETAEERATKQVSIVRQVCIKLAVDVLLAKDAFTESQAIYMASKFEDYIMNGYAKGTNAAVAAKATKADDGGADDFIDDDPFKE